MVLTPMKPMARGFGNTHPIKTAMPGFVMDINNNTMCTSTTKAHSTNTPHKKIGMNGYI